MSYAINVPVWGLSRTNSRCYNESNRKAISLILEKLDKALCELKSMRRENKNLATCLANSEQEKSDLREALKALQQTRADELFELERQKRQLYGRSSEKVKSLKKLQERSVKGDKDDFDGFNPPEPPPHEGHETLDTMRLSDALVGQAAKSKPHRSDYSKNATQIESTVMHYCNRDQVPADARPIDVRHWILYKMDWNVCKHVFEIPRLIDSEGAISNYYAPFEGDEALQPFENVLPGHHVDMDMIAQIMVDKYQYSLSL